MQEFKSGDRVCVLASSRRTSFAGCAGSVVQVIRPLGGGPVMCYHVLLDEGMPGSILFWPEELEPAQERPRP